MSIKTKAFVLILTLAVGAFTAWAQNQPVTVEKNGIKLSLTIKGDTAEITVSAQVRGWVAVGINPTNRMKDANFLIGYVKDGVATVRDDYGVGATSHNDDTKIGGVANILSSAGSELDGWTTVTFVVPLNSGDAKDSLIKSGKHKVILGASNSDSFTGPHSKVGSAEILIP